MQAINILAPSSETAMGIKQKKEKKAPHSPEVVSGLGAKWDFEASTFSIHF